MAMIAIAFSLFGTTIGIFIFNVIVARKNKVKNAFATIDAMLKKRFDLIPNLVAVAKASMAHEVETLKKLVMLRNQNDSARISASRLYNIDQESNHVLKDFFVRVESYPNLKSNTNLLELQNALRDIEDQIAAARRTYNATVSSYNNCVEMFPSSLVAKITGFSAEDFIGATEGERRNIRVSRESP